MLAILKEIFQSLGVLVIMVYAWTLLETLHGIKNELLLTRQAREEGEDRRGL